MSARIHVDPDAGRAFFGRGPLFACTLLPSDADAGIDARRCAQLAFAFGDESTFDAALDCARAAGGRHFAMVLERIASETDVWPSREPAPATHWTIERGGLVLLLPSVEAWVAMPPAQPHHLVQCVAVFAPDEEPAARKLLASLGTVGMLGRVRALVHGDSGAQIDAVDGWDGRLAAGWFPAPAASPEPAPAPAVEPVATAPHPLPQDRDALLDVALAVYLSPYPGVSRLQAYLAACSPEVDTADVRSELDALVARVDAMLWNETPRVTWDAAFEHRLIAAVRQDFRWLSEVGAAAVLAYARWLCWHEGLAG